MRPPDHVTVSIRSVICSPSSSIGSSSRAVFTVCRQPGVGWKLASMTCSGNFITIFVVSPDSFSFGTRTSNLANPPASHSLGFTVTCADAAVASISVATAAAAIAVADLISTLLFDRYGNGLGKQLELAAPGLDAQLPVTGRRQVRRLDDVRAPVHRAAGLVAQRPDVVRLERRRHADLVGPAGLELQVDLVAPRHRRHHLEVSHERAELELARESLVHVDLRAGGRGVHERRGDA